MTKEIYVIELTPDQHEAVIDEMKRVDREQKEVVRINAHKLEGLSPAAVDEITEKIAKPFGLLPGDIPQTNQALERAATGKPIH